jgi:hypothetical protein
MIKIELTFTSVAAAAAALALLNSETAVVKHDTPSGTVRPKATKAEVATAVAASMGTTPEALTQTNPILAELPFKEVKPEPETQASPGVAYKDVQAAVMKLAAINASAAEEADQTGRQAVKAVLKKMNLESFKGSPEGCWGTAIALLTAKHAELTAQA